MCQVDDNSNYYQVLEDPDDLMAKSDSEDDNSFSKADEHSHSTNSDLLMPGALPDPRPNTLPATNPPTLVITPTSSNVPPHSPMPSSLSAPRPSQAIAQPTNTSSSDFRAASAGNPGAQKSPNRPNPTPRHLEDSGSTMDHTTAAPSIATNRHIPPTLLTPQQTSPPHSRRPPRPPKPNLYLMY
ncbi:hypothetical protein ACA910_013432 [Epithemia clementina (nom. ined.)]